VRALGGGRIPITLRSPVRPSAEDIATHNLNHLPYRNWCPVCVAAKAREDAPRGLQDTENRWRRADHLHGLQLRRGKNSDDEIKMIVAKHEPTGYQWWPTRVTAKGPSDGWVVKSLRRTSRVWPARRHLEN
jgi:hypothetical protein